MQGPDLDQIRKEKTKSEYSLNQIPSHSTCERGIKLGLPLQRDKKKAVLKFLTVNNMVIAPASTGRLGEDTDDSVRGDPTGEDTRKASEENMQNQSTRPQLRIATQNHQPRLTNKACKW
ncbi:hypothetical protein Rs2_17102 [Raphanus sativus]|nr:hypothetical protein Rs2_17102 [Raphanus sativus]